MQEPEIFEKLLPRPKRSRKNMKYDDIFGDRNEKLRGKKHFVMTDNDHVGEIMEHPLSNYLSTDFEC